MLNKLEQECIKLFGECPININDIQAGQSLGYSYNDYLKEAARKIKLKHQKHFSNAIYNWMKGEKINLTIDEAKIMNKHFQNAISLIDNLIITTPVNWTAFPKDNPEITLYLGYPLDSEICQWASNYKKNKKEDY